VEEDEETREPTKNGPYPLFDVAITSLQAVDLFLQ
jgi:hypothetical protein